MDARITWRYHIFELRKKLSQITGIIYKLQKLGTPIHTLKSIYFALFHSYLNYGISVWGQANTEHFKKIETMQNKVIRLIAGADYDAPCTPIYKKLKIIKVKDLFHLQNISLMWDYDHNKLPANFKNLFSYANKMHDYSTRFSCADKLCENKKFNSQTNGINSFAYNGPKILNALKDLSLYKEAKTKKFFLRKYKRSILDRY